MYRGSDFIGKTIVSYETGQREGSIKRLLLNPEHNSVVGFVVQSTTKATEILPIEQVKAVGARVVLISQSAATARPGAPSNGTSIGDDEFFAKQIEILTDDGRDLGTIVDVYIDTESGKIVGYATKNSDYKAYWGSDLYVPMPDEVKVGKEILFVPATTVEHMREQQPTEAEISPQKTIRQAEPGAENFVLAGVQARKEPLTLPELEGKRALRTVYTEQQEVLVAQGQIITATILQHAREKKREQELIESVRPVMWGVRKLVDEERWQTTRDSLQGE
ncbi:MAG TPA: PRC-barrel domain-containing protein, partial [Candidatus Saccharimonadales bacterium]|nr:PRC-barrel domain-containing protein [Candidatus Saccharimonadales bacterium]